MPSRVLISLVLLSALGCVDCKKKGGSFKPPRKRKPKEEDGGDEDAAAEASAEASDGDDNHLTDNCADPEEPNIASVHSAAKLIDWSKVGPALCICGPNHEVSPRFAQNFWSNGAVKVGIVCVRVLNISTTVKLMLHDTYSLNRNWLSYTHITEVAEAAGYQIKPGSVQSEWGWRNEAQNLQFTLVKHEDAEVPEEVLDNETGSAERLYEDSPQYASYLPVSSRTGGFLAAGGAITIMAMALSVFKLVPRRGDGDQIRLFAFGNDSGDEELDVDETRTSGTEGMAREIST